MSDRQARLEGKEPGRIPVVDEVPTNPSALPTADSWKFFSAWGKKSEWKNDVTLRRYVFSDSSWDPRLTAAVSRHSASTYQQRISSTYRRRRS